MSEQRICLLQSAVIRGVEAVPVQVEVVITSGIPGFSIVGMPDAAIQESRERIKAALKSSGFHMPRDKIVVNLAPGSIRKQGSGFDLPIALGVLRATGQIKNDDLNRFLIVGELSLDGTVSSVNGTLAYQYCAQQLGLSFLTGVLTEEVLSLDGVDAYVLKSLGRIRNAAYEEVVFSKYGQYEYPVDFSDISGNEIAKRAFQIAAVGNHGVLMVGPPGSGKTLLARALPGILPELSESERINTALIHSIAGRPTSSILAGVRPFRDPHHSSTPAGLLGGGTPLKPGEVSLAHNGVLFLDEFPEFRPSALQQLRQVLEEGSVHLTRADGSFELPASFMLIAAMNPCPCGYYGDVAHSCTCSAAQVNAYQNKIGGPLFDRIDIHLDVWPNSLQSVLTGEKGKTSEEIRHEVIEARLFAKSLRNNAKFATEPLKRSPRQTFMSVYESINLDEEAKRFFDSIGAKNEISMRSLVKILTLARTIANMSFSFQVKQKHLSEAFMFRVRGGGS